MENIIDLTQYETKAAYKNPTVQDFCSKDKNRNNMNAVYCKQGFQIATDGRMLIMVQEEYPTEYERALVSVGKARNKKIFGIDSEVHIDTKTDFVPFEKVIPNTENYTDCLVQWNVCCNTFYHNANTAYYLIKKIQGRHEFPCKILLKEKFYSVEHIALASAYMKKYGQAEHVYMHDNPTEYKDDVLVFENERYKIIIKPCNEPKPYEMRILGNKFYTYCAKEKIAKYLTRIE